MNLQSLSIKFSVLGDGAETLKKISKSYEELKNKIKAPLSVNTENADTEKIESSFIKVFSNIKNFGNKTFQALAGKTKSSFIKAFSSIKSFGSKAFQTVAEKMRRIGNFRFSQAVRTQFKRFSNYATAAFEKAKKGADGLTSKIKSLLAMLGTGLIIKTGIEGAATMEQYRNTLETVLKDPVQAQKKLAWAGRFANRTPFETEEVVGAMTKLQSYGMEGDRILKSTNRTYLEMIGDMAAGMGKSFDQAVEALADAQTGELERLKEFGIKKDMVGDFAKLQGYGELFNNSGQIKDLKLFNRALFELMNSKFGGAMEKQAKTFKGAISTIKGVTKSALATLAGMDEFGNAIENSPFQLIRDKILLPLANWLVKMQENGTFTKWAEKLAAGMVKALEVGKNILDFCIKWKEVIIPLASALAGLFIINKLVIAIGALKAALAALSFNPVVLGIGAAIALGVLLYRNWDKVKEKAVQLGGAISKVFKTFTPLLMPMLAVFKGLILGIKAFYDAWDTKASVFENLKNSLGAFFKTFIVTYIGGLKDAITGTWEFIKNFFSGLVKGMIWTVKNAFLFLYNINAFIVKGILKVFEFLGEKFGKVADIFLSLSVPSVFVDSVKAFFNAWDSNLSIIENSKNGFDNLFSSIKDKIAGAIQGFVNLGDKIKKIPFVKKIMAKVGIVEENEGNEGETGNTRVKEVDGSHRYGLDYVPKDNYIAKLHEGERVLTKQENKEYNSQKIASKGNTYILNFNVSNSQGLDFERLGEFVIKKIKEFEEEREIAEGLI